MEAKAKTIRAGWENNTLEDKVRWFRSLSIDERVNMICDYYDLIIGMQPDIAKRKNAPQAQGPVQILTTK